MMGNRPEEHPDLQPFVDRVTELVDPENFGRPRTQRAVVEIWRDAVKQLPHLSGSYLMLADALRKDGMPSEAVRVLKDAIESGHSDLVPELVQMFPDDNDQKRIRLGTKLQSKKLLPYPMVALIFMAGALLVVAGAYEGVRARATYSWSSTSGKVVESRLQSSKTRTQHSSSPSARGSTRTTNTGSSRAFVRYAYAVEGRSHEGTAISRGPFESKGLFAMWKLDEYPVGKEVVVYYDPRSPKDCVLEPGMVWGCVLLALLGTVIVTYAVLAFRKRIRVRST